MEAGVQSSFAVGRRVAKAAIPVIASPHSRSCLESDGLTRSRKDDFQYPPLTIHHKHTTYTAKSF
jgi:hypothetical protein